MREPILVNDLEQLGGEVFSLFDSQVIYFHQRVD
jgi:hypothetical protein